MDTPDPSAAASLEELAACLRHVHLVADRPTYRALEQQTAHENGLLPGTRLRRARLTRSITSDVLLGRKFPGKAFLLTFVDACGIDLENDRRWEQAWDRLAVQQSADTGETERLRQENEELRQELVSAVRRAEAAETSAAIAVNQVETLQGELAAAKQRPQSRAGLAESGQHPTEITDRAQISTVHLLGSDDARKMAELFCEGKPVILDLSGIPPDEAERRADFAGGLVFAQRGRLGYLSGDVFLLTPANATLSAEVQAQLAQEFPKSPMTRFQKVASTLRDDHLALANSRNGNADAPPSAPAMPVSVPQFTGSRRRSLASRDDVPLPGVMTRMSDDDTADTDGAEGREA